MLNRVLIFNSKGSFYTSFFVFSLFIFSFKYTLANHDVSNDSQWRALLHNIDNQTKITDPNFFIGKKPTDVKFELYEAKKKLLNENSKSQLACIFPARQLWLKKKFRQEDPDLSHCDELQIFLKKVPHQKVQLVFSSENLSSPSSMMGHILLKISGLNEKGILKEHAISFYTKLDGLNIPKTIFDSLYSGKKGYFALSPYSEKLDLYLNNEGRNMWEYTLKMSPYQIRLLMLHLWELKQAKLKYFFHSYNCATLTNLTLATVYPGFFPQDFVGTTPLDVIKRAKKEGLISEIKVIASDNWQARALNRVLSKKQLRKVEKFIENNEPILISSEKKEKDKYAMIELAKRYISILEQRDQISSEKSKKLFSSILSLEAEISKNYTVDVSKFKIPTNTPEDSQWSLGVVSENSEIFSRISFLPASHTLEDDNSQFFSENELKLSSIAILVNEDTIKLDELSLYQVQSLIPFNRVVGGSSGKFSVGINRSFDSSLEKHSKFEISGGLGKSIEPNSAITLYTIANTALGYGKNRAFLSLTPELGIIIRGSRKYKSHLNAAYRWNEFGTKKGVTSIKFTQSIYLSRDWGAFLSYQKDFSDGKSAVSYSLRLKKHF